jgi:phage terminase small subunit
MMICSRLRIRDTLPPMAKKTNTTVNTYPDPPSHLSPSSAELWRQLGPESVTLLGRRTTFQAALEFRDRAEEARRIVASEGMTKKGSGAVHPMVRVELDARDSFTRLWHQLGLDETESMVGTDLSIK